jgi:hypothetical protein
MQRVINILRVRTNRLMLPNPYYFCAILFDVEAGGRLQTRHSRRSA